MSELSDLVLEVARKRARALPPWTDGQLAELARIVDSAPREIDLARRGPEAPAQTK